MNGGTRAARATRTRSRLIAVGRALFATQGFAGTSTEEVLSAAGTTRGALYHHFRDKADLFAAVCEVLHAEAAEAITAAVEAAIARGMDAFAILLAGCDAWLDYMSTGEARRILVLEAPTVLGWERWNELDQRYGVSLLAQGVRAAQDEGSLPGLPTDDLAILLNGAMNYAVLTLREPDAASQLEQRKVALHTVLFALAASVGSRQARPPDSDG